MTQYDGYDDVRGLDTGSLYALLDAGDGSEKVWAAWALAVRLGGKVQPELARSAMASPSSGLRRHLAVVLAGLGERALLKTLALSDPDEQVRATACQYLIHTFDPDDHDTGNLLKEQLFTATSLEVRLRILGLARPDLPSLADEEISNLMADSEPRIRQLTARRITEWFAPDKAMDQFLMQRVKDEQDSRLLGELATIYVDLGRINALLAAITERGRAQQLDVLDLLTQRQLRIQWPDLATFAALSDDAIDLRLIALFEDGAKDAFPWLTRGLAKRIRNDVYDDFRWVATDCFADLAGLVLPVKNEPGLERDLTTIAEEFEKQLKAWDVDDFEDEEEFSDHRDFILAMIRKTRALLPL